MLCFSFGTTKSGARTSSHGCKPKVASWLEEEASVKILIEVQTTVSPQGIVVKLVPVVQNFVTV